MLVLSRKNGERIHIGEGIVVTVVHVAGGRVRLGIEAPRDLPIQREELQRRLAAPAVVSGAMPLTATTPSAW